MTIHYTFTQYSSQIQSTEQTSSQGNLIKVKDLSKSVFDGKILYNSIFGLWCLSINDIKSIQSQGSIGSINLLVLFYVIDLL